MKSRLIAPMFVFVYIIFGFAHVTSAEKITFKSNCKTEGGKPLMLTGELQKPGGDGPFPAVVMMHGCRGLEKRKKSLNIWAKRLASWGYASLQVDSFGPRGNPDVCSNPSVIGPRLRAQDAQDAKSYLSSLPFVSHNQIAIIGWSHGGWAVLHAIDTGEYILNRGDPFRLAIAFYPYCDMPLRGLNAPLLILSGELDERIPPRGCQRMMPSGKTTPEIILKMYPQAQHGFDLEGSQNYNPAATNDAIEQVKNFFVKHLR